MEENKRSTLWLKVLLAFLAAMALILVVAIIMVNTNGFNDVNNSDIDSGEEESLQDNDSSHPSIKHDIAYYLDKAEQIYAGDPKNADMVVKYFDEVVSEDPTNTSHLYEMGMVVISFFSGHNLREAELKSLTSMDFSPLSDQAAHLFYVEIEKLATELGDSTTQQKYAKLVEATQEAYDLTAEATRKRNEEEEEGLTSSKGEL